MIVSRDEQLKGVALVFDSLSDVYESARAADLGGNTLRSYSRRMGLHFRSWDDVGERLRSWPEGVERVIEIGKEIAKVRIEQPVSTQRRPRWSEDDGELDIDRAMAGEAESMRELHRQRRPKNETIAVMCNATAWAYVSNESLFWRSAAAIAAIDLLEESGYSCEMWGYNMASGAFEDSEFPNAFLAFPIKTAGDPLDIDGVAKALSPWFYRSSLFVNYKHGGTPTGGLGSPTTFNRERWFGRHCQIDAGIERIWMPTVEGREEAIAAVKKILESIQR